jgi:C-terminal peptidase prc
MKNNNFQLKTNGNRLFLRFQKIITGFFLPTFLCLLLTISASARPTNSPEQRLAVFDEVWQTIRARYYDANLRGVNWDEQREQFRTRASEAVTEKEFYQVLRQMVGSLRDSHTRIYAPSEKTDWRTPRVINVGFSVREVENDFVITAVEKNSSAERAGIRVGDALISIDGVQAQTVFDARLREQTGASTEAIKRLRAASGLLEGAAGSFTRVGFRDANGRKRTVSLQREWKILQSNIRTKREGSALVIAFDIFTPETVRDFFQVLRSELRGVKSIVLDLRANRGGSAEAMTDIASAFLPENQTIGRFIARDGKVEVEAHTRRWLLYTANAVKVPNIPVAILTSTQTASAAEILTAALKKANRARTLGLPTCGCVLAIKRQHTLPDGGLLEISELDFQLDNGARLEGVGISPDESILVTRRDVITRRDRTLERALEILKTS